MKIYELSQHVDNESLNRENRMLSFLMISSLMISAAVIIAVFYSFELKIKKAEIRQRREDEKDKK